MKSGTITKFIPGRKMIIEYEDGSQEHFFKDKEDKPLLVKGDHEDYSTIRRIN